MIIVVDASVAALWYLPQQHSDAAVELLGSHHELVAPDLLRLEVGSVLLRACRRREVTRDEAVAVFGALLPGAVRLLPDAELADAAFEIAEAHGGSVYDAVYVALAQSLAAPIATNDGQMAATAQRAKVRAGMIERGLAAFADL